MSLQLRAYPSASRELKLVAPAQPMPMRWQLRRHDRLSEESPARSLTVVLDGWACRSRTTPDGRRQILGILMPGDACGSAVTSHNWVDFSLVALSPVTIEMRAIDHESPAVLLEKALMDAAISTRWIARLSQRSAIAKITDLIDELVTRQRLPDGDHVASADFRMTQYDLADATGLTAIHVNRTLRELRSADLFRIGRGTIEIPSMQRLRKVAAGLA